ncbi:MAG: hypothetical protein CMC15_17585 [Flavobacteriaceae bacterium]|nr:hypothetical protein [Flavobacteriaceae bacterium]
MCEIQFILGKELDEDSVEDFLCMLETGSYGNRDATGIFGENDVFLKWSKALYEMKETKIRDVWGKLVNSKTRWLVGHNRLATQGSEALKKNNHPFRNNVCTVVHNGVLSNDDELKKDFALNYKEETDSAIIPHLIDHYFDDKTDEVEAIKLAMEQITGSYSVFIHMNASDNLYYLKNSSTSFSFMRGENAKGVFIYGSTRESNLKAVGTSISNGVFKLDSMINRSMFEPNSGEVYKVDIDSLTIAKVAEFKVKTNLNGVTYYGGSAYTSRWDGYSGGTQITKSNFNTAKSTAPSKKQKKRDAKREVQQLLKSYDMDISEVWNTFLDEFDYVSGMYLKEDNIDTRLADANVQFNEAGQTIVLTQIPEELGTQLETYADARVWSEYDVNNEQFVNCTLTYAGIIDFIENNGVKELCKQ